MQLTSGFGMFSHPIPSGHATNEIPVWYYLPRNFSANSKTVIVLHGTSRAAEASRDNWSHQAEEYGHAVIVPHFQKQYFSDAAYAYGNFWPSEPRYEKHAWELSYGVIIDSIFDRISDAIGLTRSTFSLYGHSAGAAFAHRYLALAPVDRVEQAIVANSGWYSFLDVEKPLPFGFNGVGLTMKRVKQLLQKKVTILIGDQDKVGPYPTWWPPGYAEQGDNRFARSQTYFNATKELAQTLAVPFCWRWESVPGVGHENAKMIAPAARLFAGAGAVSP